jgi:hypothetical protein
VSYITTSAGAAPSTPAAGKVTTYTDTADKRMKQIDQYGAVSALTDDIHYNFLSNGGFWLAQRQAPATPTTYSVVGGRIYGPDRWWLSNENASVQFARVDTSGARETGLQSRHYGTVTKITATGKLAIGQVVEGTESSSMSGRTMRFQCKLKADSARTFRLGVCQLTSAGTLDTVPTAANLFFTAWGGAGTDPTLGANLSYIAPKAGVTYPLGTVVGNAVDCSVTTVWQQFSVVFDVPSTAKNLIVMVWSNAQVTLTTGTVSISEAMLIDDQALSDWAPRSVEDELARCQRYYCKTFASDTAPAANAGVTTGPLMCIAGKAAAVALAAIFHWRFPVRMRTTPATVTLFNPGAAGAQARRISGAAAADQTATTAFNTTDSTTSVSATGDAAGTVGDEVVVHVSADAEI